MRLLGWNISKLYMSTDSLTTTVVSGAGNGKKDRLKEACYFGVMAVFTCKFKIFSKPCYYS